MYRTTVSSAQDRRRQRCGAACVDHRTEPAERDVPSTGGIDPADVTYVTFTGASNQATGDEIYDHALHTSMGVAAAQAWLTTP